MDLTTEVYEIARQYLGNVRKSGPENVMAICPFHKKSDGTVETHPSFAISLTKGVYFCHSCHASGNLLTFFRGVGLDNNTIQLRYGLLLDEVAKNAPKPPSATRPAAVWDAVPIEEAILGLFDHDVSQLLPGFSKETLSHFEVGWDGWHNRITFPIRNLAGQLVGISGRATQEDQWPRYKIYDDEYRVWDLPARKGWNKGGVLWNASAVYPPLYLGNQNTHGVAVVEGFKAGMWLYQCGIKHVVALLGSYLTWEQKWILERLGATVYLFLDNNGPGVKGQVDAANRLRLKNPKRMFNEDGAIDLESGALAVRIIEYPARLITVEEAQPDSLTEEEVRYQGLKAVPADDWSMRHQLKKRP
jgi:hypothetical protein